MRLPAITRRHAAIAVAALLFALTACTETPGISAPVRLTVNAEQDVYAFSPEMRGVAMNNWNWIWSGIADLDSPRRAALLEATQLIKPGVIRFAGGLWVNNTGWDRHNVAPVDGHWAFTDPATEEQFSYTHAYKPTMIDSYAAFAQELGAETIVQVNVCDGNPTMWADLLRYTNIEHNYAFRYWEMGNEIDTHPCISRDEYVSRFIEYSRALKAVDPSIQVLGPVTTMPFRTDWIDALTDAALEELDVLAFHWYQLTEWSDNASTRQFQAGSRDALLSYSRGIGSCQTGFSCPGELMSVSRLNRITYRRGIAEGMGEEVFSPLRSRSPQLMTAITETGPHATLHEHPLNGNHLAAVWLADMLGRWAYNGLDMMTYYSLEDGNTGRGNTRGLLGIDGADAVDVRPTYLTEWLYAQHFGDMLVESGSNHWDQGVVVWASRDTADPDVLKLMLVNLTGRTEVTQVSISGFQPSTGEAYVMTSPEPLSLADPDSFAGNHTAINGVRVPDVSLGNAGEFSAVLTSVQPVQVSVSAEFEYELAPYSVTALTLRR
jgi:hypothetical protein